MSSCDMLIAVIMRLGLTYVVSSHTRDTCEQQVVHNHIFCWFRSAVSVLGSAET